LNERFRDQQIGSDSLLKGFGPPFPIDSKALAACNTADDFTSLSFELYKEVGLMTTASASCYVSLPGEPHVMPRNQAICAGLLIRVAKFISAIVVLTATQESREVTMALMRCIMDTSVTIRFLILKNDAAIYDEFVRRGLSPEAELFDLVKRNIATRGGESQPIERRLLKTITDLTVASELMIDDIPRHHRDWGGGLRKRLVALGIKDSYAGSQRGRSEGQIFTFVLDNDTAGTMARCSINRELRRRWKHFFLPEFLTDLAIFPSSSSTFCSLIPASTNLHIDALSNIVTDFTERRAPTILSLT
jgi:hypothetical protein